SHRERACARRVRRRAAGALGLWFVVLAGLGCADLHSDMRHLPPGFVRGDDIVTYSYVPSKQWRPEEACGILPYLCEYELFAWDDDLPLETFHEENVRRIDLASQWSTAIMFYARRLRFRDEIINLMIRAYQRRQLFVLRDYWKSGDEHEPFDKTLDILQTLWNARDRELVNPEGDRATGRRLINNILMVKTGDENFCGLKTSGLERIYAEFNTRIKDRVMGDGSRPWRHIRPWYNMVAWAGWDYGSCYATGPNDVTRHGRHKLPSNTEFIGVDAYDYWWHAIPYDPVYPENKTQVAGRVHEWHHIRTEYFPAGVETKVCRNSRDPSTWTSACWSDTHALLNAIRFGGADKAMLIYIGLSSSIPGTTYTTPVETMDAYYENLKAGPWVGLFWWTAGGKAHPKDFRIGTLGYVDKTLVHYTPEHPEGIPYPQEMLDKLHDDFIASRMRMFNDVVYNQFGHINRPSGPSVSQGD
ncbi:MAG: hypothetical protein JSU94_02115, partial [Phycisphaerales bacterium]